MPHKSSAIFVKGLQSLEFSPCWWQIMPQMVSTFSTPDYNDLFSLFQEYKNDGIILLVSEKCVKTMQICNEILQRSLWINR